MYVNVCYIHVHVCSCTVFTECYMSSTCTMYIIMYMYMYNKLCTCTCIFYSPSMILTKMVLDQVYQGPVASDPLYVEIVSEHNP